MDTQKTKVLVVDDEPELLRNVESWLTAHGYVPVVTSDAAEARTRLEFDEYSLVLSHFASWEQSNAVALRPGLPESPEGRHQHWLGPSRRP